MITPNIWENKKCSKPPTRWPFIVDLLIKNSDVPVRYVKVYQAGYPSMAEEWSNMIQLWRDDWLVVQ